jgi:hypothetical protein
LYLHRAFNGVRAERSGYGAGGLSDADPPILPARWSFAAALISSSVAFACTPNGRNADQTPFSPIFTL